MFFKIGALKNFAILTERKTPVLEPATLLKRDFNTDAFL